jgi:hypothetical protein
MTLWQGLTGSQRQTRELISGPCTAAETRLLSFNTTQSRVATGILTRHNALRRHLHIMGLADTPFCMKCRGDSSCFVCEALATLMSYLSGFLTFRS